MKTSANYVAALVSMLGIVTSVAAAPESDPARVPSIQTSVIRQAPEHCRIGRVTKTTGSVELERRSVKMNPASKFTPVRGTKICRGDKFITAPGAVAELTMRDGTKLTVGKDSQFIIQDFRIFKRKPNIALFELVKGAFRGITGSITKRRHRFEVATTNATIGIRGTDFWGGYGLTPDGAFDVVMLEGHGVYVKNTQGQVELNTAGSGTTIKVNEAPSAPKNWGDEKLKRAIATITPE